MLLIMELLLLLRNARNMQRYAMIQRLAHRLPHRR